MCAVKAVVHLEKQVAEESGIYRCLNDDQTVHRYKGEELPICSCMVGKWAFFVQDNVDQRDLMRFDIQCSSAIIELDEFPEIEMVLNMRSVKSSDGSRHYCGQYQITEIDLGRERISVKKVGELDGSQPIYLVR